GREALPVSSGPLLRNGGLEQTKGDQFLGFTFQDGPGKTTFADRKVKRSGAVSCRMEDAGGNCRLTQRVKVRPHACYRFPASVTNVLRRPGCPFVVASADGKVVYEEGKDYLPVRDPRLGRSPWAGEYSFRHKGPTLQLTEASRIKGGERLRVSWYHPILTHGT